MWTAHITQNHDYPPRPRLGVLHLHVGPVRGPAGEDYADVTAATDFAAFVAAHLDIGAVIVYDSRFPQREMTWAKFVARHAYKIWAKPSLLVAFEAVLAAFEAVARQRMAGPNYVPTLTAPGGEKDE